jgi:hypothetical protein
MPSHRSEALLSWSWRVIEPYLSEPEFISTLTSIQVFG